MGFFRSSQRSATVSSDGPAIVFALTRATLERMRQERPDLAIAVDDFIIRILAERLDVANRDYAALEPLVTCSDTGLEITADAIKAKSPRDVQRLGWTSTR